MKIPQYSESEENGEFILLGPKVSILLDPQMEYNEIDEKFVKDLGIFQEEIK